MSDTFLSGEAILVNIMNSKCSFYPCTGPSFSVFTEYPSITSDHLRSIKCIMCAKIFK